ncbi:MAG TPA: protease complex subunit PrcB family protein [Firmicutes bacterium]|nr:protease complex subunit PrcB family protein [Bacillota bacterium]
MSLSRGKRFALAILLAGFFLLGMAACGNASPPAKSEGQILREAYKAYRQSLEAPGGKTPGDTAGGETWREPVIKGGKTTMLPAIRDYLSDATDHLEVQFAAECLTLWGTPDADGAAILLDYLRKPGARPWAVQYALQRLLTREQSLELGKQLLDYPSTVRSSLISVLTCVKALDPVQIRQLMVSSESDVSSWWLLLDSVAQQFADDEKLFAWLDGTYLQMKSDEARVFLVQFVVQRGRPWAKDESTARALSWLERRLDGERGTRVRQEILHGMYDLGKTSALKALVEEIEKSGCARYASIATASHLEEIRDRFPSSMIARGMAAYEAVRGEPYLGIDRMRAAAAEGGWWPYNYGDGQYCPDREIKGWRSFLAQFPGHPAADDAAYRLGRCLEIEGRWDEALNALYKAMSLPDGDCSTHAAGRIAYILDAEMPDTDMPAVLSGGTLDPALRPLVEYALAVRKLRQDKFQEAADALEALLSSDRELRGVMNREPGREDDLRQRIEAQAEQARRLAALERRAQKAERSGQTEEQAQALYDLAAAIFHDELTYYNHVWQGRRAQYRWVNYLESAWHNDLPSQLGEYISELINYTHSASIFRRLVDLKGVPAEIRARALYSLGLSYEGIASWGSETEFLPEDYSKLALESFERFVREYPDSSMADDAMLAIGVYRQDVEYLKTILQKYPNGDRAEDIERLLRDRSWAQYPVRPSRRKETPLWSDVTRANLPVEVREWVEREREKSLDEVKSYFYHAGHTYVLIATGEKPTAGYSVGVRSVEARDGRLIVHWAQSSPRAGTAVAQVISYPHIVIKVQGQFKAVEFTEDKDK